jgi:pimeloyl-ACP methyl ester carboxylesterase
VSADPPIRTPAVTAREPDSLVVTVDTGDRIHFLDWGEPGGPHAGEGARSAGGIPPPAHPIICLIHGLATTAWSWVPVARRLASRFRVLAPDLRGHGLSDAPREGYDLESLAFDMLTVLEACGAGEEVEAADAPHGARQAVAAGHGFGAVVAVSMARLRPHTIAALALVDGGWEDAGAAAGRSVDELLRELADPPEVLSSMAAYLADRREFDPATWNADQERAARAAVDEKHAGHVAPVARSHVLRASLEAMFSFEPREALAELSMPILFAMAESGGADDELAHERVLVLDEMMALRRVSGQTSDRDVRFPGSGHNVMRYRPAELAEEIVGLAETAANG